jgi:hypothetical protein
VYRNPWNFPSFVEIYGHIRIQEKMDTPKNADLPNCPSHILKASYFKIRLIERRLINMVNNHKNGNDSCPGIQHETLTFSNCTTVTGSDNPVNPNTLLFVDDEITAAVAFSLENTGDNDILLTVTFSDGDADFSTTVEDGSSFAGVFANVESITIQNNAGLPITGIFKYQITYTFEV